MKKKGFTLVELLAVIAILAILVIMSLPAILRMYNSARKDSFTNEVNTIIKTARQQYLQDGGSTQTYSNVGSSNKLNLTGSSSLKYSVTMDNSGKITNLQATNGSFQYNKSGIIDVAEKDDVKAVSELSESELVLTVSNYGIMFVNRQHEGSITAGDEISIGGENFYVINSNSSNTTMLSKYNLLVGSIYNSFAFNRFISTNESGYGLQSSTAIGYSDGEGTYVGCIPFSGTGYWDSANCHIENDNMACSGTYSLLSPYNSNGASYEGGPYPYVYNSGLSNAAPAFSDNHNVINNGYTIAYYVEQYVNRLKNLGAPASTTGRILSFEEYVALGNQSAHYDVNVAQCNTSVKQLGMSEYNMEEEEATEAAQALCDGNMAAHTTLGAMIATGSITSDYYSMLGLSNVEIIMNPFTTSYWLGSAIGYDDIIYVVYDRVIVTDDFRYVNSNGVRPVIVVPTNSIPKKKTYIKVFFFMIQ